MAYAPFPLIDISGSPRERGRQHGKAAPDRIKRGIKMYSESLLKSGVDWKELEHKAEAMVPTIEKFDPAYVEEMRGIADTGTVRDEADVAQLVKDLRTRKGPVFRLVKVMVEKLEFVMPPQDGAHLKDRFRIALLGST